MDPATERQLLRLLLDELPPTEAADLEERIRMEPALAVAYDRLRQSWQTLELPPVAPAPLGFSTRIAARARQAGPPRGLAAELLAWGSGWARATAAAALLTGLAAGAGLGAWAGPSTASAPATEESREQLALEAFDLFSDEGLADRYWDAFLSEADGVASPGGGLS